MPAASVVTGAGTALWLIWALHLCATVSSSFPSPVCFIAPSVSGGSAHHATSRPSIASLQRGQALRHTSVRIPTPCSGRAYHRPASSSVSMNFFDGIANKVIMTLYIVCVHRFLHDEALTNSYRSSRRQWRTRRRVPQYSTSLWTRRRCVHRGFWGHFWCRCTYAPVSCISRCCMLFTRNFPNANRRRWRSRRKSQRTVLNARIIGFQSFFLLSCTVLLRQHLHSSRNRRHSS